MERDNIFHGLIGRSRIMNDIYTMIDRITHSNATILLKGESGTGKRMIARAIHSADKRRRDKPFVEVSCGALPREIIESELFGHVRGAFTGAINDRRGYFELADRGTILLDDIDTLHPELQVKLLRVLQQKEFERLGDSRTIKVDVRIIASTNQNLEELISGNRFRLDLFYRLNVIAIDLPPLRNRKDDLRLFINHFVNKYSNENNKKPPLVASGILEILTKYDWPGNIRELENIIERAIVLDIDNIIGKDDLPEILFGHGSAESLTDGNAASERDETLKDALEHPEKLYILNILKEVRWNKKHAAIKLGINRTTLYNKLHKYNLEPQFGYGTGGGVIKN